jgi:hypothetical protein
MKQTGIDPNYVPDRTTTENLELAQRMRSVQAEAFRIANPESHTDASTTRRRRKRVQMVPNWVQDLPKGG